MADAVSLTQCVKYMTKNKKVKIPKLALSSPFVACMYGTAADILRHPCSQTADSCVLVN